MPDDLIFDSHSLDEFISDLERATGRVDRETKTALAEIGTLVAETAKSIASEHGSRSIPGAIHENPLPNAFEIRADGNEAPLAPLWELGNKGARRNAPTFRHPVFGNRNVWVEQEKHPFLAPARNRTRPQANELMERAYDRALAPYRLRPEKI